jgi:hypothetical protein
MPPVEDNIISYKEWEEKYKPQQEIMIDFVDELMEKSSSPHHIWTVVDNNPNSVYLDVLPGYHLFNRLGFYTTEVPWTDKDMVVSNDPSYR